MGTPQCDAAFAAGAVRHTECTCCEHAATHIAALERALAYYADPDEYLRRGLRGETVPRVITDGGGIARAALPKWESVEPAPPADQS